MSEDRSLADQAASWVPPWAREPSDPPEPATEPEPAAEPEPATEPEPAAELEPAVELESWAELEPAAESRAEAAVELGDDVEAARAAVREEAAEPVVEAGPEPLAEVTEPPLAEQGTDGSGQSSVEEEAPTALALIDEGELRGALEAILLVVDEPVAEIVLAQIMEQPTDRVGAALEALAAEYAGRGFELRRAAGGWRLYTRPEYAAYVERFVLDGQSVRLTQAALETLAVIAYRQPVTRSRISAIRGVNCDGVVRTLVGRGLIEECGTEPESGAYLYRTTTLFLEKLGLDSVDQLPPLAPFLPEDVDEVADAQRG